MPPAAATAQIAEFPRIVKPTPERCRQNRVVRIAEQLADSSGAPSSPYRAVDTLGALLRNGTITPAQWQAGEQFRDDFARAHLDPLRCSDVSRPWVDNAPRPALAPHLQMARDRVWAALKTVGSPADSCIWHVLGWEQSLRQWAIEHGRGEKMSAGILVAALGALQEHYCNER